MKQTILHALLALAITGAATVASAQVVGAPAELVAYQGYLTDPGGQPLGTDASAEYDVQFAIYATETEGQPLWAEGQSITVNQGYFTVLLGEGAPRVTPPLSLPGVFARLGDRAAFLEMSVRFSPTGDLQPLLPRIRLGHAAYATIAQQARALVNEAGEAQLTVSASAVQMTHLVVSDGVSALGGVAGSAGAGLTGLNAGEVSSGTFSAARLQGIPTSKITSGTLHVDRIANMNASSILSGTLLRSLMPVISASKITSGTFATARVPTIPASRFTSGTLPVGSLPSSVWASRITSGVLPVSRGGTGRSFIDTGHVIRPNGISPFNHSPNLYYSSASAVRGLRATGGGDFKYDWPSGWHGGISTFDVLCAGVFWSNWHYRSDERLKKAIEPLERGTGLPFLLALRPVAFNWIDPRVEGDRKVFGFIAQEVQALRPELTVAEAREDGILAIQSDQLYPWMVLGIQEQQDRLMENLQADQALGERVERLLVRWQHLGTGVAP